MRRLILCLALLVALSAAAWADYFQVYVRRIDQDLYRDQSSGVYIQTRYCYEYSYGEEAILVYEPYSYNNKLIFGNGRSYDVVRVFK